MQPVHALVELTIEAIDDILAELDGLSVEQLNARPDLPEGNSPWVLAVHAVGSAEENLVQELGGQPVSRDRDAEFAATITDASDIARLRERWSAVAESARAAMGGLDANDLDRRRDHPRFGPATGWDILAHVLEHAAGHAVEASMTRALVTR